MEDAKRVLIVGAGTMGGNISRLLKAGRVPGAMVAAITDLDPARGQAAASAVDVPFFDSLEAAIAKVKPDIAYVATPDGAHRGPVEMLAAAGVAMLVEKPLATTNEDAQAMVAAVQKSGIYAEVNYSNRWNPPYIEAKRQVEAGEIGDVRSINVRLNNPITSPRDRLSWSGQTSSAWFLMSHCLDLAHWLSGRKAQTVYASGSKGVLSGLGIDTWDWIHAVVRYEGGGDGVFEAAWILPESWPGGVEFNFRVLGTSGAIDVDTTFQNIAVYGKKHTHPGTLAWAPVRWSAFLNAMDSSGSARVSFEDGFEATKILVAIHRSLGSGAVEQVAV